MQLVDMQKVDAAFAHAQGDILLSTVWVSVDISNRVDVQVLIQNLLVKGRDHGLILDSKDFHRGDLLQGYRLLFGVFDLCLWHDLLQKSCLSVILVDTDRAVGQKDYNPI